ncbi:MAG TPA: alkaline phosphatase family protein [Actinomycetota bacterium]|nr:alkaline phosphatase family protein [Actinomycetota bacterium]
MELKKRPVDLKKRIVYVIVDGMGTDAFEQATSSGRAPAFAFLKSHGKYVRDSVAVFPTITPAATASLITGATPDAHGIPGMCWYDRDAQRFVNYGQSPRAAIVQGVSQVVRDVMLNLNAKHLSPKVETIHEQLDHLGLSTASVNFMLFRGPYMHDVDPNLFAKALFRKKLPDQAPGPKEHYFADAITGPSEACSNLLSTRGVDKRIRATDAWAACVTRDLLERGAAEMILFYLHENDHASHREGPQSQVDNLAEADEHLAYVLDAFDSWEQAIDEVGFVVTADHAQSPISNDKDHILDLDEVFSDFKRVRLKPGKERFRGHDLAAAGNGRIGFVYLDEERKDLLRGPAIETLRATQGIDQVMWREADAYVVASDRGTVRFWSGNGDGSVVDERENKWHYEGDLDAVGGVEEENLLRTPEYPLAFWRIKCAMDLDRIGDVVFTNVLTWETKDLAGGDHRGGGDHASLHVQDSTIPFLSTLDEPPLHPSTVDVVPHIVSHLRRAHSR